MAEGFSKIIVERLWSLIVAIRDGIDKKALPGYLGCSARCLESDITRLRKIGLSVNYSRRQDNYSINFPESHSIKVKLNDKEFFYVYYMLSVVLDEEFGDLTEKLELATSQESNPIYDCGPAYGIGYPVADKLKSILAELKDAIQHNRKIVINYTKTNGVMDMVMVHPLHLIHTPISWYLFAWNEQKNAYRKYKLVRISQLIVTKHTFKRRILSREEIFGDSWWLQFNPKKVNNPYEIKVLFKGEAANSIKEYNFHNSQHVAEEGDDYVMMSWRMSYLYEFATWLMQWLDSIEIIEPQELKDIVRDKINAYTAGGDN